MGLVATEMPRSSVWLSLSKVLAAWMTALEGIQPTLRQTPPMYSRSTMAAFTLSWPKRMPVG